jgi:hypothetical protein
VPQRRGRGQTRRTRAHDDDIGGGRRRPGHGTHVRQGPGGPRPVAGGLKEPG